MLGILTFGGFEIGTFGGLSTYVWGIVFLPLVVSFLTFRDLAILTLELGG